ncbi:hypothetical protein N7481_006995 [Penicillium waksmanii]|uniref:uncharacterized protein n=1 Tax=Penicillium waksmanii TaxID=69791 RepID=UPI0025475E62|nr:uncharacterized protein N7481_006995 [Penicillium waksmanii]KAJ5979697.1 hypothetical protein N7481_006995 [Penicillium waksmanii]
MSYMANNILHGEQLALSVGAADHLAKSNTIKSVGLYVSPKSAFPLRNLAKVNKKRSRDIGISYNTMRQAFSHDTLSRL